MSSWNNGRRHFRERQFIQRSNTSTIIESQLPSKWISNNYFVAICAIALDEELYIDEWIRYHQLLGFSHIYIYDNSRENTLKDKESDFVTIIHFPGDTRQLDAYNIFTLSHKNTCKWAAFIDCDEFIVLKNHNNIQDLLKEYDGCSGVVLNWKMFGTSHQISYSDEPVLSRFKYCSSKMDIHYKSIVKLSLVESFANPHRVITRDNKLYDLNMKHITDNFNVDGDDKIGCIHYYYTKSEEEFIKKINRGKADIPEKRSLEELVELHSKNNDLYNSDAWDFYSKYSR
jgi:hypothetical protein